MSLYSETLESLRGAVLDVKPNANEPAVDRWINRAVRDVCLAHPWSDLRKTGTVVIPNAYQTGTVTLSPGSKQVTGTSTAWPTNDLVNAVISRAIQYTGIVEIQLGPPSELLKIRAGTYLLLEPENSSTAEAIAVIEVGPSSIWAEVKYQHPANATLIQSSLTSRQLSVGYGLMTIKAVVDPTTLVLEAPWGNVALTSTYTILGAFQTIEANTSRLIGATDPQQGYSLDVTNWDYDRVLRVDPQLNSSGDPQLMAMMPPAAGGVAQWMVWPPPRDQRMLQVSYLVTWPTMRRRYDRPPPFINPSAIEDIAKSIALASRVNTGNGKPDPHYDPQVAFEYRRAAMEIVDRAIQDDQARAKHSLQTYGPGNEPSLSAEYLQSHIGSWPSDWGR